MLSDFAEKKETCFDYKKQNFFKVQKICPAKGVNPCMLLVKINAIFFSTKFWSNKATNNA